MMRSIFDACDEWEKNAEQVSCSRRAAGFALHVGKPRAQIVVKPEAVIFDMLALLHLSIGHQMENTTTTSRM